MSMQEAAKDGVIYVGGAGTGVMWLTNVTPILTAIAAVVTIVYGCMRIYYLKRNQNRKDEG